MPSPSEGEGGAMLAAEDPDEELEAMERELTQQVPSLLEAMNRSSGEVNTLERQLGDAQDRYKKLLEQLSRLYEELRAQHGTQIERVRPYFDATQVLNAASRRVQAVIREFSAAASLHSQAKLELRSIEEDLAYGAHKVSLDRDQQDGLSRATVRVLKCQQERDRREQEYARALRDFQEAQDAVEQWRVQIGDSAIKRTLPSFRQLQKHQGTLAHEQSKINSLTELARRAKSVYHNSMKELDRINIAVHTARREHEEAASSSAQAPPAASDAAKSAPTTAAEASPTDPSPPQESPEAALGMAHIAGDTARHPSAAAFKGAGEAGDGSPEARVGEPPEECKPHLTGTPRSGEATAAETRRRGAAGAPRAEEKQEKVEVEEAQAAGHAEKAAIFAGGHEREAAPECSPEICGGADDTAECT